MTNTTEAVPASPASLHNYLRTPRPRYAGDFLAGAALMRESLLAGMRADDALMLAAASIDDAGSGIARTLGAFDAALGVLDQAQRAGFEFTINGGDTIYALRESFGVRGEARKAFLRLIEPEQTVLALRVLCGVVSAMTPYLERKDDQRRKGGRCGASGAARGRRRSHQCAVAVRADAGCHREPACDRRHDDHSAAPGRQDRRVFHLHRGGGLKWR